jgi:F0F1-type ATP synthase assembly protein I
MRRKREKELENRSFEARKQMEKEAKEHIAARIKAVELSLDVKGRR